jgi:transmembrane sensor
VNSQERIEQDASRWLAARDAASPDNVNDEEGFNRWLEADIRHRVAYLRLESAWRRAGRLKDLKPIEGGIDADLFAPPRRRLWPLAMAASAVFALLCAGLWATYLRFDGQVYETRIGGFSRIVLEDGSIIDLNTDSEVRVRLDDARRDVRLVRGEGRFQVAHDAQRPFVVSAASADVRAVGTAFSVRLRESAQVDVLVSEGEVAIASQRVPGSPSLHAGEAAVVLNDRVSVSRLEPQVLARRLAWTSGRLEFRGETLGFAVAEFNRYNRRQITFTDKKLAELRVGGSFNATDPESFAAALTSTFGVKIAAGEPGNIVLRPP